MLLCHPWTPAQKQEQVIAQVCWLSKLAALSGTFPWPPLHSAQAADLWGCMWHAVLRCQRKGLNLLWHDDSVSPIPQGTCPSLLQAEIEQLGFAQLPMGPLLLSSGNVGKDAKEGYRSLRVHPTELKGNVSTELETRAGLHFSFPGVTFNKYF